MITSYKDVDRKFFTRHGYARVNGVHFDVHNFSFLGLGAIFTRVRENDIEHPQCSGGYLYSDLAAMEHQYRILA